MSKAEKYLLIDVLFSSLVLLFLSLFLYLLCEVTNLKCSISSQGIFQGMLLSNNLKNHTFSNKTVQTLSWKLER
jgi:hypothetical protein